MARITLENISKRYGDTAVIDSLSLTIEHGEFFTLLGPSGCGKTTLLRTIAGFIVPDGGRLLLDDEDITRLPAHKRGTGMVFQDYALFPDKSVFDNVAYGLRVRKLAAREIQARVGQMLERMGLEGLATRQPAELSGGQRQRVALARALVIEPRVLLMDEPLSNLDAKLRIQMRDVIRQLQRELRITAVFVTHDQEEALSMSDRIALLRQGRIDQLDTPAALYTRPATAYAADFIGAANLIRVLARPGALGQARLELPGAVIAAPQAIERGGDALLAVRPETIEIDAASDAADATGAVPAQVVLRRYVGYKVSYALALVDGTTVHADIPAAADREWEEGARVVLHLGASCRLVSTEP
ncbi:MAG: ABC transporter ATP-binding protein [Burkholderiales bacterium]|nr:ABC transporter ATP-binding protein [Burkholderiales bacterium]